MFLRYQIYFKISNRNTKFLQISKRVEIMFYKYMYERTDIIHTFILFIDFYDYFNRFMKL